MGQAASVGAPPRSPVSRSPKRKSMAARAIDTTLVDSVLRKVDPRMRKAKIICTIGPSCWDVPMLCKLMEAGMDLCRLNFSHGDHKGHGEVLDRIREASAKTGKPVAIMLDTKGPEIRTGFFAPELKENGDGKLHVKEGTELILTTDYEHKSKGLKLACSYKSLPTAVEPGQQILVADGTLVLTVKEIRGSEVVCVALNSTSIGERKNMNLPGVKVDLPVLQPKDVKDIQEFAIKKGVDFIAASFVQSAADVNIIRFTLGEAGKTIKIISKIENREGLKNFDAILEASDSIMVARGDLGMEISPERCACAQKLMIQKCNFAAKPVIVATQMLESMCNNPKPTRAEASDVANAVLDGADCCMLSGETAGGKFPLESVQTMARAICEAEKMIDYHELFNKIQGHASELGQNAAADEAFASACVSTVIGSDAPVLIVVDDTGHLCQTLAKYRPPVPLVLVTTNEQTARQMLGLVHGVTPLFFDDSKARPTSVADPERRAEKLLKEAIPKVEAAGIDLTRPFVVVYPGHNIINDEPCPCMRVIRK